MYLKETVMYPSSCRTAMGKPFSKAWEDGDFDVLGEREEVTKSDVQHVSGKHVLIGIKVRPCLRQAGPNLSDRLTYVRSVSFFASLRLFQLFVVKKKGLVGFLLAENNNEGDRD